MNDNGIQVYFQSTLPTLADGAQGRGLRVTNRYELLTTLSFGAVQSAASADNADAQAASGTANGLKVVARNTKFNGNSWDRDRKTNLTSRLVSAAATTNATSVKGGPGDLGKISGYNAAAARRYLKLYNKTTAPTVGTDTPVMTIPLAPGQVFNLDFGGHYFSTGIAYAITVNAADADTTALTAGDIEGLLITYA